VTWREPFDLLAQSPVPVEGEGGDSDDEERRRSEWLGWSNDFRTGWACSPRSRWSGHGGGFGPQARWHVVFSLRPMIGSKRGGRGHGATAPETARTASSCDRRSPPVRLGDEMPDGRQGGFTHFSPKSIAPIGS